MGEMYDTVVIGAGIIGSSTAYCLAKDHAKVLVIEQYTNPNPLGSSHGHVRIMQVAYDENFSYYEHYVKESTKLWRQLEDESNTTILRKCGFLTMCPDQQKKQRMEKSLKTASMAHTVYHSAAEIRQDFPMFDVLDPMAATLEHDAVTIHPDTATRAYQTIAKQNGADFHFAETVKQIIPGHIVTVITDRGHYRCQSLVVTVGPWAPSFCKQLGLDLPIQPIRVCIMYWQKKNEEDSVFNRVPGFTFPHIVEGKYHIFGAPLADFPNLVKVTVHHGEEINPSDADTDNSDWSVNAVADFIRAYIPGLHGKPQYVHRCIYSKTPDENYIIDTHPVHKNIVIGAGFSGHGFNTAPITGQHLSDLAQKKVPREDISVFRLNRFAKPKL